MLDSSRSKLIDEKEQCELQQVSLKKELDGVTSKKRFIDDQLSHLNTKLKCERFPQHIYAKLMQDRSNLISQKSTFEVDIFALKHDIRQLNVKDQTLKEKISLYCVDSENKEVTDLRQCLADLRDSYLKFAEDATRISSTRIMASTFATELTVLLRK